MQKAYDVSKTMVSVDNALKENVYSCIHCGCEMIAAALDSVKVSPYFRAKNTHQEDCPVKHILTRERLDGSESDLEEIYNQILSKDVVDREPTERIDTGDRKRRQNYKKVRSLKQLVSFCLSNDVNDWLGTSQIKDFFISKITMEHHKTIESKKIYLIQARFREYFPDDRIILFKYPIDDFTYDLETIYITDRLYYRVKDEIYNKDDNDEYRDMYILCQIEDDTASIYSESQIFMISKHEKNVEAGSDIDGGFLPDL